MAAVEKKPRGAPKGNRHGAASAGKPRVSLLKASPALTKKLGREICDEIAKGTPKVHACNAVGIAMNTAQEWVRRGRGDDDRPPTEVTRWFAAEWEKAEGLDVIRRRKRLEHHALVDPKVDMWWLERRHPQEFGRADRLEIAGDAQRPIRVELAFDPSPLVEAVARRRLSAGGVIDVEAVEES